MITSRDRILTTHVGSLPRNEKLSELLVEQEEGKSLDLKVLADEMDKAVRHVVTKQMEAGIDVGNDGEQRRIGFQTYVPQRMTGFAGVSKRRRGREFVLVLFSFLLEVIVHTGAKQTEMVAVLGAGDHEIAVAQIDIEIFDLGAPVPREPDFGA